MKVVPLISSVVIGRFNVFEYMAKSIVFLDLLTMIFREMISPASMLISLSETATTIKALPRSLLLRYLKRSTLFGSITSSGLAKRKYTPEQVVRQIATLTEI